MPRSCSFKDGGVRIGPDVENNQFYPYGEAFVRTACAAEPGVLIAPGSLASCQGGVAGVFDMSGNVREWDGLCIDGAGGGCLERGGAIGDPEGRFRCNASELAAPGTSYLGVGIRCCADVEP